MTAPAPNPGHALILGASRGLGLGLARALLARAWHVTGTVRGPNTGLHDLAASNPRVRIATLDITRQDDARALAAQLAGQHFDLIFLNAGIMAGRNTPITDVPDAEIIRLLMTNAIAPVRAAEHLLPLLAPGGTLAFMSSILGSIGTNEDGRAELYRASKAALNSLIRSFAARHAHRDMTLLALHPGVVRTDMGGPSAPLDIDTAVSGVTETILANWGSGGHRFIDYRNQTIPW